jgi:hypothetical protein
MSTAPALTTDELGGWVSALASMAAAADDAERIDRIRILEEVKAACAAAQARETVEFKASQREQQEAAGLPAREVGKGVRHQVALARRESPHRGGRYVGLADALVHEMPHTYTALAEGRINEWRATLVVQATACLSREDRATVDAELADRLDSLGDRALGDAARGLADQLDPHAAVARSRKAEADRRVSLRPLPDTMVSLTGVIPAAAGVAAFTSLSVAADQARASGDTRSRGQLMADLLVDRLTRRESATPVSTWAERVAGTTWADNDSAGAASMTGSAAGSQSPEADLARGRVGGVEIQMVMTDQTLCGVGPGADEPPQLCGYGSLPAPLARELIAEALERAGVGDQTVWLRRLYTHPTTGTLVQMDSRRREIPSGLGQFLRTRDRYCRTPWCNAPIRHLDHAVPVAAGGQTSEANGQGLCEACNYAKEAPGWYARPGPGGAGHSVEITTPTLHTYRSTPPPLPGTHRRSA